jgi:hypothetical protein
MKTQEVKIVPLDNGTYEVWMGKLLVDTVNHITKAEQLKARTEKALEVTG